MPPPAPAVVVRDLWFAYRHRHWVLQDLNMSVEQGSFVALLGPSGTGKTTLLKLLAGFLPPTRGTIELFGHPLRGSVPRPLRGRIGYIPQQLGLVRSLTALENVLLGSLARHSGPLAFLGLFPKEEVQQAQALLAALGLADKAHEKVLHLSGGQRQRVAIARTLLQRPQLVLADEFVSDLDFPMAMELLATVRELARRDGITYLMALHELPLVQSFADEALVLHGGRIVHRGPGSALTFSALTELLV